MENFPNKSRSPEVKWEREWEREEAEIKRENSKIADTYTQENDYVFAP